MPQNLLIVESPAKAKTIEKYLGSQFKVKSSYGHVRDLERKNLSVDIENNFTPKYVISSDKQKLVKELREWVKKVDEVWLATDEDREGEAISWHLCKVLGLDEMTTKRIVFREITKPAIQKAVQNPRTLDLNLVDAQQARRILDRLVGYELSEVLWKKVKGNLSAGRVQSVAVKIVVEREREIMKFESKPFFRVNAVFNVLNKNGKPVELKAELPTRFDTKPEAQAFLNKCLGSTFSIGDIKVKPIKRKPAAPFTTSTLQQDASRKLGFNVSRTMRTAQRLYEAGLITYMRTDSTTLSATAIGAIADEIQNAYGANYVKTRQYKSKKAGAQEAHEAIRPTYFENHTGGADSDQMRLYELIWKRTVASQMAEAELEKTTVQIGISGAPGENLKAEGEVLKFDGFLKVYLEAKDDDDDSEEKGILPPLTLGQSLELNNMTGTERFTRPPARYTEASLVKKLEEMGIGRPSTYAPTITRIMDETKGYVIKEEREGRERKFAVLRLANNEVKEETETEMTGAIKNRLIASDLGMIVTDFLEKHFENVMDYSFTASVEKEFDVISEGGMEYSKMLAKFYHPFHETVEDTKENAQRASGERKLGKDPVSGRTILVRLSRFGPVVQIGTPEELGEDEKPKYTNLAPGMSMETVTLEETIDLFKLPRELEEYKGQSITIASGRFGPYIKTGDDVNITIPRGEDPLTLSQERAQELIDEKRKELEPVGHYKELPITKGKGRFGPFLKWNGFFANVSKKYDFENLSQEEILEIVKAKEEKEANRYIQRWPELKLSVQNGRWGPFIKYDKKKPIQLKHEDGKRMTPEEGALLTLEQVKKMADFKEKKKKKPAKKKAKPKAKAK